MGRGRRNLPLFLSLKLEAEPRLLRKVIQPCGWNPVAACWAVRHSHVFTESLHRPGVEGPLRASSPTVHRADAETMTNTSKKADKRRGWFTSPRRRLMTNIIYSNLILEGKTHYPSWCGEGALVQSVMMPQTPVCQ